MNTDSCMADQPPPSIRKATAHCLIFRLSHVLVLRMQQLRARPLVRLSAYTSCGRRHMGQHQAISHQSAGHNAADAQHGQRQQLQPAWCTAVAGAHRKACKERLHARQVRRSSHRLEVSNELNSVQTTRRCWVHMCNAAASTECEWQFSLCRPTSCTLQQ